MTHSPIQYKFNVPPCHGGAREEFEGTFTTREGVRGLYQAYVDKHNGIHPDTYFITVEGGNKLDSYLVSNFYLYAENIGNFINKMNSWTVEQKLKALISKAYMTDIKDSDKEFHKCIEDFDPDKCPIDIIYGADKEQTYQNVLNHWASCAIDKSKHVEHCGYHIAYIIY